MANVYRKKNPAGKLVENWYCAFRVPTPDGKFKQVHRSTGKTTKTKAKEQAAMYEEQALKDACAGDYHKKAIMGKLNEAAELALKNRLNPAVARKIIGELMALSGQDNVADMTTRQWFDDWLKEKKATTKKATGAFYQTTTKEFLRHIGDKADSPIDAITTKDIRDYRDDVRDGGRTAKTCNHKLKALRSVFGDALKHSVILYNPCAPIKSLVEDDSVERLPFTKSEVSKIVMAAPSDDWKGVILLGAFAGLRLRDAAQIKVGNIDMKRKILHFMPKKTDRRKVIVETPMHPELIKFFKNRELPPFDGSSVFDSLAKKNSGGSGGLSGLFRDIMDAAGVDRLVTRKTEDGAARESAQKSFHSLRHTFTSWLAEAGVSEEVRMTMTGHTESTTHQKYTHHETERRREGVDRISSLKQTKRND